MPLIEENKALKDSIHKLREKNDTRFETIRENLEVMAKHMNNIKK